MKKQIIINASQDRSRIAIVEDGELVELYVENPDNVRTIGNIYLGKVEKVMPTLRAGFVNIGEKQDAFLHFSDLTDNFPQLLKMSGEDVPGLDEPVLSLAPQKRIADDESEPDVEDVLEVESADEETAEPSRSRSTRSRRTRGRGGRGRTSEEEQEEAGDERPSRRGMMVLDLSSPSKTSAPKPASRPAPAAPKAAAPSASAPDAPADVSEPVAEAVAQSVTETPAPRSRRAPRAPRTAADLPPVEDETTAEIAEVTEAAPKPKRSRSRKPAATPDDTAAAEMPAAETAADAPEAEPTSRSRRGRSAESRATAALDAPDTAMAGDATDEPVAPTARPRRQPRNRPAPATPAPASTPVADAPDDRVDTDRAAREVSDEATAEDTTSDAPRSRSRRRTRGGSDASAADTPQAEIADTTPVTEAPAAPAETVALAEAAKPRPRGLAVVDLSSGARPTSRPAPSRPEPARAEPARTEPDAPRAEATPDEDDAPRSRRRGRDERPDAPTTSDSRSSDDASDTAEEDTTRSRRRPTRRSATDDAQSDAPETDAPADDTSDDDAPRSRGRRSTRGRSDDARTADDDRSDDAPEARSDESPDTSRGRRSTRDGRDGSGRDTSGRDSSSRDGSGRDSSSREASSPRAPGARRVPVPSNEQLLRRGGNVIVKVTKEPISAKGSRVSTDISLAGRFLVLVPAADYVAVSKKIESAKERRRLRTLAQSLKPDNCGVIVRTVAEGRDAKSLDTDLRLLIEKWHSIEAKLDGGRAKAPILLYEDVNMVSSIIRDLFSEDFDRILVDDPKVFKNVQAYVKAVAPDMADKVELHRGSTPAFRSAGIEKQVEEAFSRRVNLKSGGYLFIETTEAMHVVDVNSGRAGRGKSQKENMISVNVEAAREVAKQLRLRDLGGIIVVDFIDLRLESDRRKVTNVLKEAFEKDRAVTKLLPMSDFGLVQITRQRLRPSITAQPEGEDTAADPAERAARAGAGEIEQAGGRRGRGDDARGLDAGPGSPGGTAEEDARPARSRDAREERDDRSREERPAREPRGREDRSRDDRARDDRGERPERPERARRGSRRDDAEDVAPEPAASPESAAALLRGWLDNYRRTVDEAYRHRPVVVRVHPLFLTHLQRGLISVLTRWRIAVRNIPWRIEEDAALDPLAFDIRDEKSGRSLLKKYSL